MRSCKKRKPAPNHRSREVLTGGEDFTEEFIDGAAVTDADEPQVDSITQLTEDVFKRLALENIQEIGPFSRNLFAFELVYGRLAVVYLLKSLFLQGYFFSNGMNGLSSFRGVGYNGRDTVISRPFRVFLLYLPIVAGGDI